MVTPHRFTVEAIDKRDATAEILRSFFVLFLLFDISEELEELLVYLGGREFLELKLAEVYSLSLLHREVYLAVINDEAMMISALIEGSRDTYGRISSVIITE